MSLSEDLVRKLSKTEQDYQRRVYLVAAIYLVLNTTALISIGLIVWHYRFWVTTAQRSNVETLTFGLIVALFAYLVATTFRGGIGALRIVFYHLPLPGKPPAQGKDGLQKAVAPQEARKQAALKPVQDEEEHKKAYFNLAVCAKGRPNEPIRIPVQDAAGSLGEIVLDGVEAVFKAQKKGISNSLFEYLLNQLEDRIQTHNADVQLQIVQWSSIDDEEAAQYHSQVQAFRTLATQLDKGPIWPTQELTRDDIAYITARIQAIVPALRDEAFLPDVEYGAEYSIPIIPEPLGFVSLRRTEQRADPVATMGCAALVALTMMAILIIFLVFPPWLPSR
ncbi:MAG: hypothetical protein M3Z04_15435 [Chloroflexota bacterium]|nr:hypothetical protein [Chloroflexota bacterium]